MKADIVLVDLTNPYIMPARDPLRSLVYHAFAGKPHNLRKTAAQILGTDVAQLTHDVWAAAAQGGGWVDYDFLNPTTGLVAPKTSFVVPVGADLVLGCGIYKTVQRH